MEDKNSKFIVFFHGTFIPLQGVEYIVRTANILKGHSDILFRFVGKGQTYNEVVEYVEKNRLSNVEFLGYVPVEDIPNYLQKADICLGIFGDVPKTKRVIPNKVYEGIAMNKPVLTADTPAIREVFKDRLNILLCKVADEKDLADKILELKEDRKLKNAISNNGYQFFIQHITSSVLVKKFLKDLHDKI
ncbi:MAG: glycosyltransferase [Patescibacteria group bacterium]|nr:glycosyltransferase [Patescibacteria group bacterium]